MMRTATAILITCMLTASGAYSNDRIREFFEWGEYDSLMVVLGGYFSSQRDTVDSDTDCVYFSYLGVAYFAKGDIAESGRQFRTALDCMPSLTLDKKYVTPEMMNLFLSIKNEKEQQRAFSTQEESIKEATVFQQYEQQSNKQQEAELSSSFWRHTSLAIALGAVSIALGSLAVYEYSIHNSAAALRCALPSALCGGLCVVFTIQSVSLRKAMHRPMTSSRENVFDGRNQ